MKWSKSWLTQSSLFAVGFWSATNNILQWWRQQKARLNGSTRTKRAHREWMPTESRLCTGTNTNCTSMSDVHAFPGVSFFSCKEWLLTSIKAGPGVCQKRATLVNSGIPTMHHDLSPGFQVKQWRSRHRFNPSSWSHVQPHNKCIFQHPQCDNLRPVFVNKTAKMWQPATCSCHLSSQQTLEWSSFLI